MFSARHWPWLTLYAVVVFGALVAGGLEHLNTLDALSYSRWEARQGREAAARCRVSAAVALRQTSTDDTVGRPYIQEPNGDLTVLAVAPEGPEPTQAELENRLRTGHAPGGLMTIHLSLRWDPLRRCVPGIPATRWLTQHGNDGGFEWPAGIGCGK